MQTPVPFAEDRKNLQIQYAEALNPSQLEAVNFNEGSLLVIAGAGSGKTRTLTYRVARLVEEGVLPGSILLLTFTRKASQEMLKRAATLLDNRCERIAGGTFHSFANAMLRRHASQTGFTSGFTIMDRSDAEALIGMLRKEMGIVSKSRAFPRKQTLANIFSRSVNKALSIEEVISYDYPHFTSDSDDIILLYREYKKRKAEHYLMDYDDLLTYFQRLLKDHPQIRAKISSSCRYIMVDEYQDTNQIQADIVYLLAESHKNIMVVGDDSQSIYAFRGANFRNIMEFPEIFPDTKVIKLEENYRSVQPILALTNVIIDRAVEKYSKNLFTQKSGGSIPLLVDTLTENSQSRFIVDKIMEFKQQGIPLNEMAVLFRAGFHSFDLEIELGRYGISFVKVGGFKFMESAHIKDVLAHLRVIFNPYDRISWYRILLLLDKVGPKTAQNIYEEILREQSGYTGIFAIKDKATRAKGIDRLKDLFAQIDSNPMSVAEMGATVLNYYEPILVDTYDDHPKRARDLEHLITIMERYHQLESFLADMALEPPNTSIDDNLSLDYSNKDHLILSTVHSAKGLEWHTVFIIWTLDGRFPSIHALNNEEDLEEELRLMYVAATRAKENLFFSYPMQIYDRSSGLMLSRPSRFIDRIPHDLLERRTIGI
ncbi:MAG: ATP-dependent helicase [Deltaproteobacteria bacterium]|nr:ATP-dependent helicase [Deltaproteobacteria bacterium]MBW2201212.1 ATP-dependent helicase [Deltaproteobacteria bacterium]